MKELPYTISLPPKFNAIIVHAGLLPNKDLEDQIIKDMIVIRNIVEQDDGSFKGSDNPNKGLPWIQFWDKAPRVFFGHDAKRGLQKTDWALGLDSGCCYGSIK